VAGEASPPLPPRRPRCRTCRARGRVRVGSQTLSTLSERHWRVCVCVLYRPVLVVFCVVLCCLCCFVTCVLVCVVCVVWCHVCVWPYPTYPTLPYLRGEPRPDGVRQGSVMCGARGSWPGGRVR
jgi:hypothetical protein